MSFQLLGFPLIAGDLDLQAHALVLRQVVRHGRLVGVE